MNYTVKLYVTTKAGMVDTHVKVFSDACVEIAYRMIEAGMLGTMNKRHWSFGFGDDTHVVALLPMYRKVVKNDLTRYMPRVAPQRLRGSHQSIFLTLETLAESNPSALHLVRSRGEDTEAEDQPGSVDAAHKMASQTYAAQVVKVRESAEQADELDILGELKLAFEHFDQSAGAPPPEVVNLPNGDTALVTEWEEVDMSGSSVELAMDDAMAELFRGLAPGGVDTAEKP